MQTYVLGKKKSNMQSNAPAIPNKRQREVAKKKRAKVIKETVLVQESKLRREGGIKTTQGHNKILLEVSIECRDVKIKEKNIS